MGFKCGIIGLPNIGKSTLFNALTNSNKAEAANYPFATIEPNVGRVSIPDERLNKLSIIGKSEKVIRYQNNGKTPMGPFKALWGSLNTNVILFHNQKKIWFQR